MSQYLLNDRKMREKETERERARAKFQIPSVQCDGRAAGRPAILVSYEAARQTSMRLRNTKSEYNEHRDFENFKNEILNLYISSSLQISLVGF